MESGELICQVRVEDLRPNRFGAVVNPPMSSSDLEALKASVAVDGIRVPLVVWKRKGRGVVVAGCNRLAVARELGMEKVPVVVREFKDEASARLFALTDNAARRHMNAAQRAEVGLEIQRLIASRPGRRAEGNSSKLKRKDSWADAARMAGVSIGMLSQMRAVLLSGDDDLVASVRRGETKVSAAAGRIRPAIGSRAPSRKLSKAVASCFSGNLPSLFAAASKLHLSPGSRIVNWTPRDAFQWAEAATPDVEFLTDPPKNDAQESLDAVILDWSSVFGAAEEAIAKCLDSLKPGGQLWVTCRDRPDGTLRFSHLDAHRAAVDGRLGLEPVDLLILKETGRPVARSHSPSRSAPNHVFLWIFRKPSVARGVPAVPVSYVETLERELRTKTDVGPLALDLFAGCGGLSLGFEAAGFTTVAFEKVASRVATYNRNLTGTCSQAELVDGFKYPDADIVIAGPPCQPWSAAGRRLGPKDSRDGMHVFLDAVSCVRPKVFLLENVKGILSRHRWYFDLLLDELRALGYQVEWKLLDAVWFGVPQHRERVFVVGHRSRFEFPKADASWFTAGDAIEDTASTLISGSRVLSSGAAHGRAGDIDLSQPARTVTCMGLACPGLQRIGVRLPDGRKRSLSLREAARLQGFPDRFDFEGTAMERFRMVGDAVPPPLAKRLALAVMDSLNGIS